MGRLTDDMADLRMNIDNSRDSRLAQRNALVSEVNFQLAEFASIRARNGAQDAQTRADFITQNANDVGRLLTAFRHSRQMMRRQGRETRADFLSKMSKDTLDLLTSFNADRKSMAERNAKDRADFIANMTNTVAAFINEAAQDRAGAHAAFFGTAPSKKKTTFPPV